MRALNVDRPKLGRDSLSNCQSGICTFGQSILRILIFDLLEGLYVRLMILQMFWELHMFFLIKMVVYRVYPGS